jgi:N-acetylglucosaminyl-diphospho-decaprenol L-rhamnosyltransferase
MTHDDAPRARTGAVAVVVVSYNTRECLRACLATVVAESPAEVVVVDNGSADGSVETVRREFPTARVIEDGSNPGYGAASNQGVAACDAPYVLLLNSDTLLRDGTLEALREYMDQHPRAALAGPRLVHADGSAHRSCYAFPSTTFLILEHSPLRRVAGWIPPMRRRYFIDWSPAEARAVPWVHGAALMLRRSAFEAVGGFDPSFHMYYEEVDLAYRLAAAGWETHFAPVAEVTHVGGASTSRAPAAMKERNFRSLILFGATHMTAAATTRLATTLRALVLAKLAVERVRRRLVRDPGRRREFDERVELWRAIARVPFVREAATLRAGRAARRNAGRSDEHVPHAHAP